MKKKCTAFLIVLCLVCNFTNTVFASDSIISGWDSADTVVTYHMDSKYMVYIPATLDLTSLDANNPYKFTACTMALQDNEKVCVKLSKANITLSNTKGNTISGFFNRSDTYQTLTESGYVAQFTDGQLTCDYGIYFTPDTDYMEYSGDFTGTVTFSVSLETN